MKSEEVNEEEYFFIIHNSSFIIAQSGRRDSNPRPTAWKAVTLPTELLPRVRSSPVALEIADSLSNCLFSKKKPEGSENPTGQHSQPANRQKGLPFGSVDTGTGGSNS